MTHEQAVSEMHYRLCKFLLQNLREAGIITADEESECRLHLIREIQPFIGVLEGGLGCERKSSPE